MENNISGLSFEEAIARLEVIVRSLENGSAELDKSLALFEEGISLVRVCNDKITNAESKIKILLKSSDGSVSEEDFTNPKKDES